MLGENRAMLGGNPRGGLVHQPGKFSPCVVRHVNDTFVHPYQTGYVSKSRSRSELRTVSVRNE